MAFWKRWIVRIALLCAGPSGKSHEVLELRSMELRDRCDELETSNRDLLEQLAAAAYDAKSDRADASEQIKTLESRITVFQVEIKELMAVITRLHAIKERETAIEVMKADYATKGGMPHHVRVPD